MTPPNLHLWLIPILPLIGAAINGLFGKRFSRRAVATVALAFCGAAFGMALWIAAQFSSLALPHLEVLTIWLNSGGFSVDYSFALDQLSLIMLLIVTGVGFAPKIILAVLISFFPVVIAGVAGLRSTDPELLDLSATMGAGRWRTFRKIRFPQALPHLMAGLKVAVTLAVVGAVVGEFVGASEGLGHVLLLANGNLDAPLLFADLFLMSLLGIVLFVLVEVAEALLIPWHPSRRGNLPLLTS